MPAGRRVSVIIPAYNAENTLSGTLQAVYSQETEAHLEVVTVDDGSTDRTPEIISEGFPSAVLVRTEHLGCDGARQAGLDAATGDVLANTDADCIPGGSWIESILQALDAGATAVTGPVIHKPDPLASIVAVTDFGDFQSMAPHEVSNFPGCNFALTRNTLGKYDYRTHPELACGADRLLAWRIASRGGRIAYVPGAAVQHYPPVNPLSLIARRKRYCAVTIQIRKADRSLPGGKLAGLGRLAAPVYCSARLLRDIQTTAQLAHSGRIPFSQAPGIAAGAIAMRACDLVFMLSGWSKRS